MPVSGSYYYPGVHKPNSSYPTVDMRGQGTPVDSAAGTGRIYMLSSSNDLYFKDPDGNEILVAAAGLGAPSNIFESVVVSGSSDLRGDITNTTGYLILSSSAGSQVYVSGNLVVTGSGNGDVFTAGSGIQSFSVGASTVQLASALDLWVDDEANIRFNGGLNAGTNISTINSGQVLFKGVTGGGALFDTWQFLNDGFDQTLYAAATTNYTVLKNDGTGFILSGTEDVVTTDGRVSFLNEANRAQAWNWFGIVIEGVTPGIEFVDHTGSGFCTFGTQAEDTLEFYSWNGNGMTFDLDGLGYIRSDPNGIHLQPSTPNLYLSASIVNPDGHLVLSSSAGSEIHVSGALDVDGLIYGPGSINFKSYSLLTAGNPGTAGIHYAGGYYTAPAADANLTQASTTQTLGAAGISYAAHAFLVAKQAGTANAGTVQVVVSGTSITDAGVRTASDTELLVASIAALGANQYVETTKKWLGQITYKLGSVGAATYALDFNYGFCKYEDWGNRNFICTDFETVLSAGKTDDTIGIKLLHHTGSGWNYHATAFVPGSSHNICDLTSSHGTDDGAVVGGSIAFKRSALARKVLSRNDREGVVVKVTSTVNGSIEGCDIHVGVTYVE